MVDVRESCFYVYTILLYMSHYYYLTLWRTSQKTHRFYYIHKCLKSAMMLKTNTSEYEFTKVRDKNLNIL